MKDINILKNNGFNVDSVIETFGGMDLYDEILMDFYNESADRFVKLKEYYNNKDFENYTILVHTIKGECAYLGITNLTNISYEHQLKSETKDLEYITNNFATLYNELIRVVNVIKLYFNIQ